MFRNMISCLLFKVNVRTHDLSELLSSIDLPLELAQTMLLVLSMVEAGIRILLFRGKLFFLVFSAESAYLLLQLPFARASLCQSLRLL